MIGKKSSFVKVSLVYSIALVAVFATACSSSPEKKIVVMSSGKIKVDPNTKTVTLEPGTQHNEAEIVLSDKDKGVTVKSPAGEQTFEAPENGLYLLNLKTDTLIGNIVNFGNGGMPASISNEQLEHMIDSTRQLINGLNASDANKTYFLQPQSIKRITANLNAQLINPYNGIPYQVQADQEGHMPEIYKFFTAKQKRESLEELIQRIGH